MSGKKILITIVIALAIVAALALLSGVPVSPISTAKLPDQMSAYELYRAGERLSAEPSAPASAYQLYRAGERSSGEISVPARAYQLYRQSERSLAQYPMVLVPEQQTSAYQLYRLGERSVIPNTVPAAQPVGLPQVRWLSGNQSIFWLVLIVVVVAMFVGFGWYTRHGPGHGHHGMRHG